MVGVALADQQAGKDTVVVQLQSGLYIPSLGGTLTDSALSPQAQSILGAFTLVDNNLLHVAELSVDRLIVAGDIEVAGTVVAAQLDLSDQSAGRGQITAGQTSIFISTPIVSAGDKIIISPVDPGVDDAQPVGLYRGDIQPGIGFSVKLRPAQALGYDQPFDWLIIK